MCPSCLPLVYSVLSDVGCDKIPLTCLDLSQPTSAQTSHTGRMFASRGEQGWSLVTAAEMQQNRKRLTETTSSRETDTSKDNTIILRNFFKSLLSLKR